MKKALAIIVFLALFVQTVAQLGVIGYYEVNKDYIAKNLCENRDKPQMKCCGKCYLKKQLKKVDDTENSGNSKTVKIEKTEIVYLTSQFFSFTPQLKLRTVKVFNPLVRHFTSFTLPNAVFHPPALAC